MESLNDVDAEDLAAFVIEVYEILSQFEQDVLVLERGAFDQKRLDQLYRALHTIKGNCGFLPLPRLEMVVHAGETLLDTLRTTQQNLTPEVATALLQLTDSIRQTLQAIETTATEGTQDDSALIATLTALCTPAAVIELRPIAPKILASQFLPLLTPAPDRDALDQPNDQSVRYQAIPDLDSAIDSTVRVQVNLLDHLINVVSELVLVRNQVLQLIPGIDNSALKSACQQINLITNDLQDSVMQTRMQPISVLWRGLPRLIRESAIACAKNVALKLDGSDTELDRSLIAAIKDPVTHLIRNCIDHGIESAEQRVALGKPVQGTLSLRAFQANGKVVLEIQDDGAGMDPTQLKTRAQQLGIMSATEVASLTDRDALNLVFLPGFSTATAVTRLSGRGVGMDVVRRNLELINGTIEIESQLGYGTTFRLKIPLTLAIIPALIIVCRGERFAIPQVSVQELIRIEGQEQIGRSVETLLNVPVYRLRGQILPLVDLASGLQLQPAAIDRDLLYFVVIAVDGYRFGLIVDQIEDTQDVVVKPLSRQLKSLDVYAGVTILGDGQAALILDMSGFAQQVGVQHQSDPVLAEPEPESCDRHLILIVLGPQNTRLGICLTHATRLEMVPRERIEQVGEQYVMQYGDRIATVLDLEIIFTGARRPLSELEAIVPVVVITLAGDQTVGLIVQQILDTVEESLTVTGVTTRPGTRCYATVQGQITEMLDLDAIVELANPYRLVQGLIMGVRG